jgi:predicted dinucleotide-binding enzyme
MNIGIIGAGSVGGTLGRILASKGHTITFGVRNPQSEKVRSLLESIPANASAVGIQAAAAASEVVLLATPWEGTQEAIANAGDLSGKVLIDCTNPVIMGMEGLAQGLLIGHTTSGAEEVAQWAKGAKVVKAFNTMGYVIYDNPTFGNHLATAFICGDDADAKAVTTAIAQDVGLEVVDAGGLTTARLLEPAGMLWIHLALFQQMGVNIAINLVKR